MCAIMDPNTPATWRIRNIENHYHLQMLAENTRQIAQFQAPQLALQAEVAAETNRGLAEIGYGLANMNYALPEVAHELGIVGAGIQTLNATARRTEAAVWSVKEAVDRWLSALSQQIQAQQKTMDSIADTLRRPLETTVLEIRRHADHALKSGMKAEGEDRAEWYRDAGELLQSAVSNPIGKQDYVAWFQIGWLYWKADEKLPEAEEAFARATRLSSPNGDVYHVESLRHLAYTRHLQGNLAGAYDAIRQALQTSSDHQTLFDAARYAAVTERREEALQLLECCIREEPVTVVAMLAESDFSAMKDELGELESKLVAEARGDARTAVESWQAALQAAEECQRIAECAVRVPADLSVSASATEREVDTADYLTALEVKRSAAEVRARVLEQVGGALRGELESRKQAVSAAQKEIREVESQARSTKEEADKQRHSALEDARRRAGFPSGPDYTTSLSGGCLSAAMVFFVGFCVLANASAPDRSFLVLFSVCLVGGTVTAPPCSLARVYTSVRGGEVQGKRSKGVGGTVLSSNCSPD